MQIQSQCTQIDGETMRYLRSGSGPPLLLLHGLIGGTFCWRFNTPVFSERYTTFAIELPGCGETDAPRNLDCGMETQALRLLRLMETLALESADVVGTSWGGAVALFLAGLTRKVRSLVLAAPANPWSDFGRERIRFLSGRLGGSLLRLAMPLSRPLHRSAILPMYGNPERVTPGTVEGYSALALRQGRVHNILNSLRNWEKDMRALRTAIDRVQAPSLLIWGTRDRAVDLRSSEALMQALPDCKRALLPGIGHLSFEEAPEEFNRLVLDFLGASTSEVPSVARDPYRSDAREEHTDEPS